MIDNIELNVRNAKNYVEKAQEKMDLAKKHHQSSKKVIN